jgi:hypothetical protein
MTEGITYYRREDGIHVYRFENVQRSAIDTWVKLVLEHDQVALKTGEHRRCIYDLRGHWVTPYLVTQALYLASVDPPDLQESIAVLGLRRAAAVFNTFVRRLPRMMQSDFRFFYDEAQAVKWLTQRLEELG